MSRLVRIRLEKLNLLHLTNHQDRVEIDREIERRTGLSCDEGVKMLTDEEFKRIVDYVLRRKKKVEVLVV